MLLPPLHCALDTKARPLKETIQARGIECDLCDEAIDGIAVSSSSLVLSCVILWQCP